jgi:protein SCO1/2
MSRSPAIRFRTAPVLVVLALLVGACSSSETPAKPTATTAALPAGFSGYVRTPLVDVSSVTLPDVKGTPVKMVADPGGILIVFFGYGTCPDICPMTLSVLKAAIANQTPVDRKRVDVAMVTVDPTRDTGERFGEYLAQYFPRGLALRTDEPRLLRSAADTFGADYRIRMNQDGQREVSHSADLYVVDDTGKIVLIWSYGLTPEAITADLGRLLAGDRPDPEK